MEQPQPTLKLRKRDRFKAIFRPKTPQPSPSSQSSSDAVANASNTQNPFKRSENFKKDIAVLSMAYPISENPDLKELIRLIVAISTEEKVIPSLYHPCAFTKSFFSFGISSKPVLASVSNLPLSPTPTRRKLLKR